MDRRSRRYVPSSEGLEGRQLLSTATTANPAGAVTTSASSGTQVANSTAQQTIEAKLHRIQNLPYFLGVLNTGGVVVQPATANIQKDLLTMVGQLHEGSSAANAKFNVDLRHAQKFEDITPGDSEALNRDFGKVLISAGAAPATVADLQANVKSLVRYASTQVGSTIAATNDYSIVLQVALGTGRPLVYPNTPALLGSDHQGNHGKVSITHNHRPTLIGTYSTGTNIQIVDTNNRVVLGQATVDKTTGGYSVRFNNDLPDGVYTVRVRAEDSGYLSLPSPRFTFQVVTTPPKKK